jgi:hypothetical protein
VELVIPGHLLDEPAAAIVLEDDEIAQQVEEPDRIEDPFQQDLQLGCPAAGQLFAADGAPGLEPLPAPTAPIRACTPSDTTRAALQANRDGISAW